MPHHPRSASRSSSVRISLLVAAFACAVSACGPNHGQPFRQALAEAERAQSAGRYAEAAEKYEAAAKVARLARDAEHARYLAAMMQKRSGNAAGAAESLRALAASTSKTAPAEAAEFQLAEMAITSGDPGAGLEAMERFFRRHPSSGLARPALTRVLREKDATLGERGTIAYLRSLQPTLDGSDLGETIAYAIAVRLASQGDTVAARDALLDVATRWPYPGGALFDDALYRASELEETLGRYDAAVAHLERMLRERETTTLMGSYQRPRYSPALLRIAELYRDRLHDRARARAALHRLYTDFKTSTFRDDALYEEAKLFREDGDQASACARLATLVGDFPDSKFVPCAVEQCPTVRRPEKSRAPEACRAYLTRGTGGGDAGSE